MDEYTFADLIINPEAPNLESLIGKEVYFNDVPTFCIRNANDDYMVGILMGIHIWESAPFYVEIPSGLLLNYACIIPKKEESEPKYIPFESVNEFIDAYDYCVNYRISRGSIENKLLSYGGIWLKGKVSGFYYMVVEIRSDGVVLAGDQDVIFWSELLKDYVFLEDSSCGRLVEEKHE